MHRRDSPDAEFSSVTAFTLISTDLDKNAKQNFYFRGDYEMF